MLMREGAIVFHGPRGELPGYLRGLGFLPPLQHQQQQPQANEKAEGEGKGDAAVPDLADWIVELLTFPARRHRKDLAAAAAAAATSSSAAVAAAPGDAGAAAPPAPSPPLTTAGLASAWRAHPLFAALMAGADDAAATS